MLKISKQFIIFSAVSYTLLIAVLSLASINKFPSIGISFSDKIFHALAYFGLAFLWQLSFISKKNETKKHVKIAITIFLYGLLIECFQYIFTTHRNFEVLDAIANAFGVFIGTLFVIKNNIIKLK